MMSGHYPREIEIVRHGHGGPVGTLERKDVPQGVPAIAPIRIAGEESIAPVEVADQRLCKREPSGILRCHPRVGGAKGGLRVLPVRTKAGLCVMISFEEHGTP